MLLVHDLPPIIYSHYLDFLRSSLCWLWLVDRNRPCCPISGTLCWILGRWHTLEAPHRVSQYNRTGIRTLRPKLLAAQSHCSTFKIQWASCVGELPHPQYYATNNSLTPVELWKILLRDDGFEIVGGGSTINAGCVTLVSKSSPPRNISTVTVIFERIHRSSRPKHFQSKVSSFILPMGLRW